MSLEGSVPLATNTFLFFLGIKREKLPPQKDNASHTVFWADF